ncbi:MAG: hypothetical protein IT373_36165, partial [Polyangiaceae bacterium]|nr:hypothetical protein [Polyangiaceae bacterium]
VGGSWKEIGGLTSSESVLGAKSLVVAGAMSIKAADYSLAASVLKETYASRKVTAGGKRVEAYGGAAKYKVGGAFSVKGAKVHVKAKSKIVLDGAGAKITITSGKVVVDAAFDVSAVSVVTGNYAAK